MGTPYGDSNPNEAAVEQGLEAAENERREAVADAYEEAALQAADAEANLNDIDHTQAESPSADAELSAIRVENLPSDNL